LGIPAVKIVVGIPAFNEEKTVAKVVVRSRQYAEQVLVIDDGSNDDTGIIAAGIGAVVIRHNKNLGKGAAIRDCFEWAKQNSVDVLVTLDGDGQHDPRQIPTLLDALRNNDADVVVGGRLQRPPDMPVYKWVGARMLDKATTVKVNGRTVDAQSGFRAYSRKAISQMTISEYGMGVDAEILVRARNAGMKIMEVPVTVTYDGLDTSAQNPVMHAVEVIFSLVKFTSIRHPLSFFGGFGVISLGVSLVFGLWTIDYYQKSGSVATSLALVSAAAGIVGFLALFTGIILTTLITVIREHR
jgi:glycosyltransferase involved in cell wall biosynthesis